MIFWIIATLMGCGKPLQRPVLSGPSPAPSDRLILGRELTAQDLKALFKILNEKGEFNTLATWVGSLSDAELANWGKFVSYWAYEDALSSQGLIQILKSRSFESVPLPEKLLPVLFEDDSIWDVLPRLVPLIDSNFINQVVRSWSVASQKAPWTPEKNQIATKKILEELREFLKKSDTQKQIRDLLQLASDSNWVTPVSKASKEWLQLKHEEGFVSLAEQIPRKIPSLNQAFRLAKLLNRPADKVILALQQGLQSNPDIVHALSIKWEPIFVRSFSEIVKKVLVQPEDGSHLDQKFWLSLPRENRLAAPTPQFVKLYSILFSGMQKIADPRKMEVNQDSGSYRIGLQLNALFLTHLFEEAVRESAGAIKNLSPENFDESFWSQPIPLKEFSFSLVNPEKKNEVSDIVKMDLQSLGLHSVASRLESLVREPDSGKNSYAVSFNNETVSMNEALSQGVAAAHSVRPFSDVTPFLVTLVHNLAGTDSKGGFSLEILKTSPNILAQAQGFFAQLSLSQWKMLRRILFEELKIGQLEIEDRALLISLFQSDLEVAEWLNEVLVNIQSIYELEDLVEFYQSFLKNLTTSQMPVLGEMLGLVSDLGFFAETEEGQPKFPGFYSILSNGNAFPRTLRGLAGLSVAAVRILAEKIAAVAGENLQGQSGFELLYPFAVKILEHTENLTLSIPWEISERESRWIQRFSQEGGFSELKLLLRAKAYPLPMEGMLKELKTLSQKKVVEEGMRLLSQIQNERIKEIALVILKLDREFQEHLKKGEIP